MLASMVMSTPRWTADDLPDLSGRTALVTGATSGIGRVTATELARHGARVILAVRNPRAGADLADELAGSASVLPVDLASLESVHRAAATVDEPIDLLVNNAGDGPPRCGSPRTGRSCSSINHLGHFALTGLLPPRPADAPAPRDDVSSIAHRRGSRQVLQANQAEECAIRRMSPMGRVSANLLFAMELQRRAEAAGVPLTSTAAHPGSRTQPVRQQDGIGGPPAGLVSRPVMGLLFPTPVPGPKQRCMPRRSRHPGPTPPALFGSRGPVGPAG